MRPATPAAPYQQIAGAGRDAAPSEFLDTFYLAWHTTPCGNDGAREYLTCANPAEFRSRNILTGERPLRRARSGLTLA